MIGRMSLPLLPHALFGGGTTCLSTRQPVSRGGRCRMRGITACTVIAALACTGCYPLLSRTTAASAGATCETRVAVFRESARKMPLGSLVEVRLLSGERVRGRLRRPLV